VPMKKKRFVIISAIPISRKGINRSKPLEFCLFVCNFPKNIRLDAINHNFEEWLGVRIPIATKGRLGVNHVDFAGDNLGMSDLSGVHLAISREPVRRLLAKRNQTNQTLVSDVDHDAS